MVNRTVVIRRKSCSWHPKIKRKIQKQKINAAGFINPVFVVIVCGTLTGLLYLYSINQTAMKGLQIRNIEKEISQIKNENENLKIKEAALKSLYQLEEASKNLNMSNLKDAQYIEETPSVALVGPSRK